LYRSGVSTTSATGARSRVISKLVASHPIHDFFKGKIEKQSLSKKKKYRYNRSTCVVCNMWVDILKVGLRSLMWIGRS
jgi:hypothetical protein